MITLEPSTDVGYLHDDNAGIIATLPALATDLVGAKSYTKQLLNQIETQLNGGAVSFNITEEFLQRVYQQLMKKFEEGDIPVLGTHSDMYYVIDENKSMMLNLVFGSLYQRALEIYTYKYIDVVVYGTEDVRVVEDYFNGKYSAPVVVKVYDSNADQFLEETPVDLVSQLGNLGLRLTTGWELVNSNKSYELRPSIRKNKPVVVDLKAWYCSCASSQGESLVSSLKLFAAFPNSKEINKLRAVLSSKMKTQCQFPSKLPICSHLLATVIAAYNTYPGYTVRYTSNFDDLYE